MKYAAIAFALLTVSSVFADDTDPVDPGQIKPVTPVQTAPVPTVAPIATQWTLKPVVIELMQVLLTPNPDPETIRVLVEKLTPEALSNVVVGLVDKPVTLGVLINQLTSETLKAVVSKLPPEKILELKAALFLADPTGWAKAAAFLEPEQKRSKLPTIRFTGNWIDAGRTRLQKKIAKEGYTPENLATAQALMDQASKPQPRGNINQLKGQ